MNSALRTVFYLLVGGLLLIVLAVILYPSITFIRSSLTADGRLSLDNYGQIFAASDAVRVLRNTLVVASLSTLGATVLGALLAWLTERVQIPLKRVWEALLVVPYLIPPFIGAVAWVYLLGPVGYINRAWQQLTGTRERLFVIYGEAGIILVMIFYSYPIAYLVLRGPMRQMSGALEEAARISGAKPWRVLVDVTLPLLVPNIGAAALLVFMAAMSNFGIPAVIGFPARYFVLTNEIYNVILNFSRANNLNIAAAMSMQLVVISLVALALLQRLQGRRSFATVTGKSSAALKVNLGRGTVLVVLLLAIVVVLAVVAPLLAIFATAITRAPGVPLTPETATLQHFNTVFTGIPKVGRALGNSLGLAATAATTVALLSVVVAYLTVRLRVRGRAALDALITLPYALPGTVVALAMILTFIRPLPLVNVVLYNTIWILLIAYIAHFLAFGTRAVSAALQNVDTSLEEAARISGADRITAFRHITLPLVRDSIVAAWFLAFMPSLTELTLSALLFSVGTETIGQVVFGLYQEGRFNLTAALAVSLTLGVLALSLILNRFNRSTNP